MKPVRKQYWNLDSHACFTIFLYKVAIPSSKLSPLISSTAISVVLIDLRTMCAALNRKDYSNIRPDLNSVHALLSSKSSTM